MPFPLAHPAAVLPLRRYCPQWLNFPALVIGSLVPDIAYGFDEVLKTQFDLADLSRWIKFSHLADLSHVFIVGAFSFDFPVGFMIWLVFQSVCRPVIALLPLRFQQDLRPMCRWPAGFPWVVAASILIGTWTHLLLDSVAHGDGWIVMHVPILQHGFWPNSSHPLHLYDILYYALTFCGAGWLAFYYFRWLETTLVRPNSGSSLAKWEFTTLFALCTTVISIASRGEASISLAAAAILSTLLVLAFLAATIIFARDWKPQAWR